MVIGWVGRQFLRLSHPAKERMTMGVEVELDEVCHPHKSVQILDGKEA